MWPCAAQADEELLLLEAIDMYGPGSWKDVWRHVGTKSEARNAVPRLAWQAALATPAVCVLLVHTRTFAPLP